MKKLLIALLFPVIGYTQDTTAGKLLVVQGIDHRTVIDGYVITIPGRDTCTVLGYLVASTWGRKPVFKPVPRKYEVIGYDIKRKKK